MNQETRWKLSAARENKRRTERAPLLAFAGLIPMTTPNAQQRKVESERAAFTAQWEAHRRQLEKDWVHYRELCVEEAPEQMAALDARFERYRGYAPNDPAYRCDFWYQRWHDLQKSKERCQPGRTFCTCRERWDDIEKVIHP
jgi:hypothetical protein